MTAKRKDRNIQHYSVHPKGWYVIVLGKPRASMSRHMHMMRLRAVPPGRAVYIRMLR